MLRPLFALSCTIALFLGQFVAAGEIGYVEDFALAADRAAALKQLIPGTEDYYYYHCLFLQHQERFAEVEPLKKVWIEKHGRTARVLEIENRQALLTYPNDPKKSLEFLRTRMGLHFNHQREVLQAKPNLPTALNQNLISREHLTSRAFAVWPTTTEGFEDRALDWLTAKELGPEQRRSLLQRLQRPDYPNLVELIHADSLYRYYSGFGSYTIHRALLLSQLEDLVKLRPALLNEQNFVNIYLTKLQPATGIDWQNDPVANLAYLERLEAFVGRLNPAHNSLKAHVLYQRLLFDRQRGVFDKERFLAYLKLPRNVDYIEPKYASLPASQQFPANIQADFRAQTLLPPIGHDEALVRTYLLHFLKDAANYKEFADYINDNYLKQVFAETKIVNGLGDADQWSALLPPDRFQMLKDRVDLDFAFANKKIYTADEAVSLEVMVKNVKSLIIKVYEVNAFNYYRVNQREVDTDVNLDGLVANDERIERYDESPFHRVARRFDFPQLTKPGVYVIDFIGNGQSSRALIRKGKIRFLQKTTLAGQVFTLYSEANKKLLGGSLWLAGHEYKADAKTGDIILPFSTAPGRTPIILSHGGLSTLEFFQHQSENYELRAGIHIERESILSRRIAKVVVRPGLYINGVPGSLALLKEVKLTLTSTDLDGITTSKEVDNFKLSDSAESTYEFQTPPRLNRLAVTLAAKMPNVSLNRDVDLAAARAFVINEIDKTEKTEDLHLILVKGEYAIDLLGKTGEAKSDRPVHLSIKHRDFKEAVTISLQTDAMGRLVLGALAGIDTVTATGPEGVARTWRLPQDQHTYRSAMHGREGEILAIPYMGSLAKVERSGFSLLELRGETFVADRFDALSLANGLLQVKGLLPGDYNLLLKEQGINLRIRIAAGDKSDGFIVGANRQLQIADQAPIQIASVQTTDKTIDVKLVNATKFARVHVFATRFDPAWVSFDGLARVRAAELGYQLTPGQRSAFVEGRNIGDEYRYILDRRMARKFAGNMLQRPQVLLNPWSIRKTQTDQQAAQGGDEFRPGEQPGQSSSSAGGSNAAGAGDSSDYSNLDFLAEAAAVILNIVVDEKGIVSIPRDKLGKHQEIQIVAVDPEHTVSRIVSLPEERPSYQDLRLLAGLDPALHFTQQKQITFVPGKQPFVINDIATSRYEAYDDLASVYGLYLSLSADPKLIEFSFLLRWNKLKEKPEELLAEKKKLYSKYACHELNFFLFKKDPEFFKAAVLPYLANKYHKTFLDHWLLTQALPGYMAPWSYERLNVVERILLGEKVEGEREAAARHIRDLFALVPPDQERFNRLFHAALRGSSLDTSGENWDFFVRGKIEDNKTNLGAMNFANGTYSGRMPPMGGPGGGAPAKTPAPVVSAASGLALDPAMPQSPPPPAEAKPQRNQQKQEERLQQLSKQTNGRDFDDNVNGQLAGKKGLKYKELKDLEGKDAFYETAGVLAGRESGRRLYTKLDSTEEWAENNYYKLLIEQQNADLVTVNAFWRDYAERDPAKPFVSTKFAEASRNFTEMMLALAVLDLPFEAPKHDTKFEGAKMTLTAGGPLVAFHEEIRPSKPLAKDAPTPILVSQNFFRYGDRYRQVDNEQVDKYVTDEFLTHVVYGTQIVITNPTSSRQKLDVLLQIPVGAMPVLNFQQTKSLSINLEPFHTQTVEYYFYFPVPGEYRHYPVHISKGEILLASAPATTFKVVKEPSKIDKESWEYVSQFGTDEQVVEFLRGHNILQLNLEKIAFRMQDAAFFKRAVELLAARHVYNHTLWSYAIKHDVPAAINEFLKHADQFVAQTGPAIASPLLTIDPVARKSYQHLEYAPLVNARRHALGKRRQILNDRFNGQYHQLMNILAHRKTLDDDDLMAVTYYMLLQDRVEDAIGFFGKVDAGKLATKLQHDYFTAYIAFYTEDREAARAAATKHLEHPVDRWRNLFTAVVAQLSEADGKAIQVVDVENREQNQTNLAATQPNFDLKVEARKVTLSYQNLSEVQVNYYLMDIELLFSRNPFVQEYSGQFSFIKPNGTASIKLPPMQTKFEFDLPEQLHNSNVLVEVVGAGEVKTQAYYANSLAVQTVENYGQVRVNHATTGKPVAMAYVKVFAQMTSGETKFYKDGYTDIRGRFDYTSLNTNEIEIVKKFSILILSDEFGAAVKEASPPKR